MAAGPASPDDDLASARRALAEGDPHAAVDHLAQAIAADPNRPETLTLLDEFVAGSHDPTMFAPIDLPEPPFHGLIALHAYCLAGMDRLPESIDVLTQAIVAFPEVAYIEWLIKWLDRPEAEKVLPVGRLAWFVHMIAEEFGALKNPTGGGRGTLDWMPTVIRQVRNTQLPDAQFLAVSVRLLSRMNLFDDALECAREAHDLSPSYETAFTLAMAHESRKEAEPALKAYEEALGYRPDDVNVRLNMAGLLWHFNRPQQALEKYQEVLEREPRDEWALPSALFLRWMLSGEEDGRDKLLAFHEAFPENERGQQLAEQASPYFGYLPEPSDQITTLLKGMVEKGERIGRLGTMNLQGLDAPSNYLAIPNLYDAEVNALALQDPDPRFPRRRVEWLLWRYDDLTPRPAMSPPDPRIGLAVACLAGSHFYLPSWQREAGRIAQRLGPGSIDDLLATMVYPPMGVHMGPPWAWVYRVQVAVALIVSQIDSGWQGSLRRRALLSLVHGPADWTVDAGLVALLALARDEEELVPEVTALFKEMLDELPKEGTVSYTPALLWCLMLLPGLEYSERLALRKRWRAWLKLEGSDAEGHYLTALIHQQNRALDKAIEELTAALTLKPDYLQALLLRGQLAVESGASDQALIDLTRTLELHPKLAQAFSLRGEAHLNRKEYAKAHQDLTEAISLKPEEWRVYDLRASVSERTGALPAALVDLSKALELQPNHAELCCRRARAYAAAGQLDRALADLGRAIELAPHLAEAYRQRARCQERKGNWAGAVADLSELVRLQPGDPILYNERARLHCAAKNWAKAIADYETANRLAPDDALTCDYLAWLLVSCPVSALRDGRLAVVHASRACELTGWKFAGFLNTLAAACAECRRFEEAVQHAQRALEVADEQELPELNRRLELYRAAKPYREK